MNDVKVIIKPHSNISIAIDEASSSYALAKVELSSERLVWVEHSKTPITTESAQGGERKVFFSL